MKHVSADLFSNTSGSKWSSRRKSLVIAWGSTNVWYNRWGQMCSLYMWKMSVEWSCVIVIMSSRGAAQGVWGCSGLCPVLLLKAWSVAQRTDGLMWVMYVTRADDRCVVRCFKLLRWRLQVSFPWRASVKLNHELKHNSSDYTRKKSVSEHLPF